MDSSLLQCAVSLIVASYGFIDESITTQDVTIAHASIENNAYTYDIVIDKEMYGATYRLYNNNTLKGKVTLLRSSTGEIVEYDIIKEFNYFKASRGVDTDLHVDIIRVAKDQQLAVCVKQGAPTYIYNTTLALEQQTALGIESGRATIIRVTPQEISLQNTHLMLLMFVLPGAMDNPVTVVEGISAFKIGFTELVLFFDSHYRIVIIDSAPSSDHDGYICVINNDFRQEYLYKYEDDTLLINEFVDNRYKTPKMKRRFACRYDKEHNKVLIPETGKEYQTTLDTDKITYTIID